MDSNTIAQLIRDGLAGAEVDVSGDDGVHFEPAGLRRSSRLRKPTTYFDPGIFGPASKWKSDSVASLAACIETVKLSSGDLFELMTMLYDLDEDEPFVTPKASILNESYSYLAQGQDPDVPVYWDALTGDEAEEWFKAMDTEIQSLVECGTWDVVY